METNIRWTWADLVSSYRFWALVIFSFSIFLAQYFMESYLPMYIRSEYGYGYEYTKIEMIFLSVNFSIVTCLSIIPAWIASRAKSYYFILLYAFIIIVALLSTYYYMDNLIIIGISLLVISVLSLAIGFLIAGILAKAIDSIQFFVLAFGLVLFLNFISTLSVSIPINLTGTIKPLFLGIIIQMIIATLLLLPAKKSLFNEAPAVRYTQSLAKEQHSSVGVFFLSICIPFYIIYWCVRAHRDIRNYSQSATLLTPTAAGWCSALVPFAIPVMLINLTDVIDEYFSISKRSRWGLILLSFFLLPVAIALVQSRLNQLPNNTEV